MCFERTGQGGHTGAKRMRGRAGEGAQRAGGAPAEPEEGRKEVQATCPSASQNCPPAAEGPAFSSTGVTDSFDSVSLPLVLF